MLRDRLTGREYTLRARYLVGADGAKSKVVDELGLNIEGHLARAGTVYVIFKADLSRYVAHRPSILHWIVTPSASFGEIGMGLLRAVRPWDRWIAGWGFDISRGEPDPRPRAAPRRIRTLVGDPELEVEIERSSGVVREPGLCHRVQPGPGVLRRGRGAPPPAVQRPGPQHLRAGRLQLAWKLAYVIKGYAGPGLLDSYSAERAPVGRQIVTRANQSRLDYAPSRPPSGSKAPTIRWRRASPASRTRGRKAAPAGPCRRRWSSRTPSSTPRASR
jgi:2,4-dichlorophenol 6-monooxygenase